MARTSQRRVLVSVLAFASLLSTGCIVAEAPDYGSLERSPPFMSQPNPNPMSLQDLQFGAGTGSVIPFSVTVRSEDAGEQLVSVFYIDYKHEHEDFRWAVESPRTFDQPRTITYTLAPTDLAQGTCHSITIMAMHLNNWDSVKGRPREVSEDFASVTWFVATPPSGLTLVSSCPTKSTEKIQ